MACCTPWSSRTQASRRPCEQHWFVGIRNELFPLMEGPADAGGLSASIQQAAKTATGHCIERYRPSAGRGPGAGSSHPAAEQTAYHGIFSVQAS